MTKKPISQAYLKKLRNIGIIAHIDAGKTTLTERILFYSHKIHRMGEVHDGMATMDFMPEEQERGITIAAACTTCKWRDKTINILDTPGHVDFTVEVERSLRVLDGAVGVFCAVSGVEPQSETVWRQSEKFKLAKLAFVNKMDRPGADFTAVLQSMRERLSAKPLAMQVPLGQGQNFKAVLDLLTMERLEFDQETQGAEYKRLPLALAEQELAAPAREELLETLAEEDDEFMALYLSGERIGLDEIKKTIRRAVLSHRLVPVFLGSAFKKIGVQPVMDAVVDYLPDPEEAMPTEAVDLRGKNKIILDASPEASFAALVFKIQMEGGRRLAWMRIYSGQVQAGDMVFNTVQERQERLTHLFKLHADQKEPVEKALAGEIVAATGLKLARTGDTLCAPGKALLLESIDKYRPVISLALEPKNSEQGKKLDEALERFLAEDPTLFLELDQESGQRILSGMGELHLEVVLERIRREYNLELDAGKPGVVFQETITAEAAAEAEFHRELGEDMHYGFVGLSVEPLLRGQGLETLFDQGVLSWPQAWLDAVRHGVEDSLQSGIIQGYPMRDVRVRVLELKRREGESSPAGFQMAAVAAIKQALGKAKPVLLEPIMEVEVFLPDEFVGEAVNLLSSKGARVGNMYERSGARVIKALAPMRGLFGFATLLRSATQGRAGLAMKFSRFDVFD